MQNRWYKNSEKQTKAMTSTWQRQSLCNLHKTANNHTFSLTFESTTEPINYSNQSINLTPIFLSVPSHFIRMIVTHYYTKFLFAPGKFLSTVSNDRRYRFWFIVHLRTVDRYLNRKPTAFDSLQFYKLSRIKSLLIRSVIHFK